MALFLQETVTPPVTPPSRRRTPLWLILLIFPAFLGALVAGHWVGSRWHQVQIWDPLWIRALLERPLDEGVPGAGFWVAGYYVDYDRHSLDSLRIRAPHLDQVVSFGYGATSDGQVIGRDPEILKGVTAGQKRVILFGNLTGGKFSRDTAQAILRDKAVQDLYIHGVLGKVAAQRASGVQIDFEGVAPEDRQRLTSFIQRLAAELRVKGLTLSMAVPAKVRDDPRSSWAGAFDYAALGQLVDQLFIMAYDEHYRGGEAGPVASLPWTEKVIRYAISVVPTKKILLGVPLYGYDWTASGQGRAYGVKVMQDRLLQMGAEIRWDPVLGENVASYKAGDGEHVAWFPDERSLEAKLALAQKYNLKGVALWRLGFEPDQYWVQLGQARQSE
ncbi:MAG: glycosyl hydrolase family 18 protein [Firmicutes bacterium]|nr:glycosyl hydrolase family 18 protein [Bacillota bacterium]